MHRLCFSASLQALHSNNKLETNALIKYYITHSKTSTTRRQSIGVFSLTWPTSMQIYWNKRKRLHKKRSSTPTGLSWYTNMVAVSLFWEHQYGRRDVMCKRSIGSKRTSSHPRFEPWPTEEHSERDANPKPPARDCPKGRPLGHATRDF